MTGIALTRDELLDLLIEECAEVIQAATKCKRFGFESGHATGYGRNDIALAKEMGNLYAVLGAVKMGPDAILALAETFKTKMAKAENVKELYGVK